MTLSPPAAPSRAQARSVSAQRSPAQVRATAGQRAGAYLIDVAIVAATAALVWLTTGSLVLLVVAVVELWVIGWIWEGHTGGTPGNVICGIRTVRRDDAVSVGAARLFGRSLLMGVSHIVPVLLPISLAASGALDGVARARMIDLRRARQAVIPGADRMPNLEARVSATGSPVQDAAAGGGRGPVTQVPLTAAPITQTPLTAAPALSPAQHTAATPAAPTPAPAAAAHPAPTEVGTIPVFELADGTVIRATGLGFIGRAPRAPESIPEAILVRVPDGARSLSRTHASFGVEDGQLWVQDLGSANGASVRHLGGGVTALVPQSPYFLVAGDVLILGGDAELAFRRIVDRPARAAEPEALPIADAPSPQAAPASGAAVALQFQDGTTVPIHGTGYIGRAPSLPEGERTDAALIAVPDGDRSVSRTHGRFGLVDGQTWFEDLGSGNGSSLRTGDGRSGPMTPHQRFGLVPGMVLQLGDCIIRVVAA